MNRKDAARRLHQLGFLEAPSGRVAANCSDKALANAARAYQGFHGLPAHGKVCSVTARHLARERFCAHPDCMAETADATAAGKWGKKQLAWGVVGTFPGMTAAQTADLVRRALASWAAVADLTFVLTDPAQADVVLSFAPIDGPQQILAQSELPPTPGFAGKLRQQFDNAEAWVDSENPGPASIDAQRVLAHEIGHALGLAHIQAPGNLRNPIYSRTIRRPQAGDVAAIDALYGPPQSSPPAGPDLPPPVAGVTVLNFPRPGASITITSRAA